MLQHSRLLSALLLGITTALPLYVCQVARAGAVSSLQCADPQPGRYVVMGQGSLKGEPVARILQETWKPDGSLEGVRLERRGTTYSESPYTGNYRPISACRVAINRSFGSANRPSQAVLDPTGHPRYSLGTLTDLLSVSRWFEQPQQRCDAALLDGNIVSMQTGYTRTGSSWEPNAVIQNEHWQQGNVKGIAVMSVGPSIAEVTYKGTASVSSDCLATIKELDSLGTTYNYRAVVLAGGNGYIYLQTDPDDLTVGFLERLKGK